MTVNVDAHEIEQFDQLAEEWWDTQGPLKTLHVINPVRMQFIQTHIDLSQKTVLDVGCGGGILSEALAQAGANVTGIDMAEKAIVVAKNHAQKTSLSIDYQVTTAEDMADAYSEHFDVVTCLELLEHIPRPSSVVQACAQLVKPDGTVFFSTINRTVNAFLSAIVGAEYVLNLLPKGTHHYQQFIRPSELVNELRTNHLFCTQIAGLDYHPFKHHASLTNNVRVNYLLVAKKDRVR